ncbi:MAG: ORC1-type DNA replication protein [Desulfurococcaceae archaeon]|jgi:cell division control protein 6
MGVSDTWKIIEEELNRPSIFRSRESLMPEHLPEKLPHRENELRSLVSYFKHLVTSPGSISQRVLIVGGVGTGKTALSKLFGRVFTRMAREKGYNVSYAHVNCHRNRTLFNVIYDLSRQLGIPLPSRGLSAKEMFDAVLAYLEELDSYAIIALDEFHYFASVSGSEAVYFISRTYDVFEGTKRVNFIFIASDTSKLAFLNPATEGYLLRHIVKLEPYTSSQLFDILKYRAELSFYEGTYDDEVLKFIAEYEGVDKGGGGNARHALEILLFAGDLAEKEGKRKIELEHVRKAIMSLSRDIVSVSDAIKYSTLHELLVLLSIIRLLRKTGKREVRMGEVEEEYRIVCETLNEVPRRHTQLYEYVRNLARSGIIRAEPSGKGYRGRSTLISLHYGPLDFLEKYVLDLVKKRKELGF